MLVQHFLRTCFFVWSIEFPSCLFGSLATSHAKGCNVALSDLLGSRQMTSLPCLNLFKIHTCLENSMALNEVEFGFNVASEKNINTGFPCAAKLAKRDKSDKMAIMEATQERFDNADADGRHRRFLFSWMITSRARWIEIVHPTRVDATGRGWHVGGWF